MVDIDFETHVGSELFHDYAANSTGLRIPFNVVAAFKGLSHWIQSYFERVSFDGSSEEAPGSANRLSLDDLASPSNPGFTPIVWLAFLALRLQ